MINYFIKQTFLLSLFILSATTTFAAAGENEYDSTSVSSETISPYLNQTNSDKVEMADLLRSNGMIYVVVGVILIVLIGLIIYLISLDSKIGKLEKEVAEREPRTKS